VFPVQRGRHRKTLFIKGNREDFVWLDAQPRTRGSSEPVLPSQHSFDLGGLLVGGVGGRYGPSNYGRRSRDLQSYAKRHYTREGIDTLISSGRLDVLLTHGRAGWRRLPAPSPGIQWPSAAESGPFLGSGPRLGRSGRARLLGVPQGAGSWARSALLSERAPVQCDGRDAQEDRRDATQAWLRRRPR
jgi:hypothetical protein